MRRHNTRGGRWSRRLSCYRQAVRRRYGLERGLRMWISRGAGSAISREFEHGAVPGGDLSSSCAWRDLRTKSCLPPSLPPSFPPPPLSLQDVTVLLLEMMGLHPVQLFLHPRVSSVSRMHKRCLSIPPSLPRAHTLIQASTHTDSPSPTTTASKKREGNGGDNADVVVTVAVMTTTRTSA